MFFKRFYVFISILSALMALGLGFFTELQTLSVAWLILFLFSWLMELWLDRWEVSPGHNVVFGIIIGICLFVSIAALINSAYESDEVSLEQCVQACVEIIQTGE